MRSFTHLFPSSTLVRVLALLLRDPQHSMYMRQIARDLNVSVGDLQRHLRGLEKEGILQARREGPLKHYRIHPAFPYTDQLRTLILGMQQKDLLHKNLRRLLKELKTRYRPEKVIVFGSFASGKIHPDSDLDMIIIKKDVPANYWDRVREISPLLVGCNVGVDCTVWTPEEWEADIKDNIFLQEEVLGRGKVVYERAA